MTFVICHCSGEARRHSSCARQDASNAPRSHSIVAGLHAHHVEAAGRLPAAVGSGNGAPRTRCRRCLTCPTLAAAPPKERLARWRTSTNTRCRRAVAHHQVDFTPAAPGRPIIARQQLAGRPPRRWASAPVLGGISGLLGGGAAAPSCGGIPLSASFSSALNAAREAAASQHYPQGALYVVATPIGNLADISCGPCMCCSWPTRWPARTRATRRPAARLWHRQVGAQLLAVHQHNEASGAGRGRAAAAGQRMAYVSDAGTPGVSDPGRGWWPPCARLACACVPLPGASSVTASLSVAGWPGRRGRLCLRRLPAGQGGRAR